MYTRQKTSSSTYEVRNKKRKRDQIFLKKNQLSGKKASIGIILGVSLTLVTIALQCVAFFTPHWKEVSPNTHSLYVDGIDALIRTEVLHYFNSVHRYTRHSYGLFERCEYLLSNSSKYSNHRDDLFDINISNRQKTCTKNFLPSYRDEHFDECHSLPYYRFCTKKSEKIFDISNDYLRATFDISASRTIIAAPYSCDCHYPPYVKACHVFGILALIFLFVTSLLFGLFPFVKHTHHRLKLKCFAVLSSLFSILFIMINLIITYQHLEYESIEYLIAIERHYKLSQIYKLSQDMKTTIDRFLLSINIRTGYSAIIAWIAFVLSIIDGIFLLVTCKISHDNDDKENQTTLIPSDFSQDEELRTTSTPLTFTAVINDPQSPPPALPVMNNHAETYSFPSDSLNKKYQPPQIRFEDEV
jgi:hypothetical protein